MILDEDFVDCGCIEVFYEDLFAPQDARCSVSIHKTLVSGKEMLTE